MCIGNINRSRAAEAIFKSKNLDLNIKSRGLLPSVDGQPMGTEMFNCLSKEEQNYVSPKAEQLSISDIEWADYIIVMDYYVLDLLRTRFSELYWQGKIKFYTQFKKNVIPYDPIEDPFYTKNYKKTYEELKYYQPSIISSLVV